MANKYGRQDTPVSYKEYVESEQSLLEQIRVKEEELNAKISATEQEYSGIIDNARKEALEILGQYRHAAESEAEVIWQQALEKAGNDVEQIRSEGEKKILANRERKQRHFDAVVERVVRAVRNA